MEKNRQHKRDTLIITIHDRWVNKVDYRLVERASDRALEAFDQGKTWDECIKAAETVIEGK